MGSASSCASRAAYGAGTKSVKVIGSNGRLQEFLYSINTAELMVENPGQFVCDSNDLQVGFRVRGLSADEELMRCRLYFLLPTELLFSVLTEEEMVWLLSLAAGATKVWRRRRSRKKLVKMRKEDEKLSVFPAEKIKEREEGRGSNRMQRLRSWEPALDTIEEEGIKI